MRYPLYTLLIEDSNGLGQPVGFAVLSKEDQAHLEKFLELFSELNDTTGVNCFVVDKDLAEINAIKKVFPNIHINICYFHVLKAADKYLSSLNGELEKKSCIKQFETLLTSKSCNNFDNELLKIQNMSLKFYNYILENWVPFKNNITSFSNSNIMNLQNRTNNRIERFHHTLKRVLGSAQLSLDGLIKNLLTIMDVRSYETHHRQFDMNMKTAIIPQPNVVEYYKHFTDYAAGIIAKQIQVVGSKKYSIIKFENHWKVSYNDIRTFQCVEGFNCSCGMPTQMGIPCRHLIAVWMFTNEPLFQPLSVSSRWRRETSQYFSSDASANMAVSSSTGSVTQFNFDVSKSTRNDRFNSVMVVLKDLASIIADQPSSNFNGNFSAVEKFKMLIMYQNNFALNASLQNLIDELQPEKCTTLDVTPSEKTLLHKFLPSPERANDIIEQSIDCPSDQSTTSSIDFSLISTAENVILDLKSPQDRLPLTTTICKNVQLTPNKDNLIGAADNSNSNDLVGLNKVIFQQLPKPRGRPVAKRARPFKVKRKYSPPSEDHNKTKKSKTVSLKKVNGIKKDVNDSICFVCGAEEPSIDITLIDWIACSNDCGRWFHTCCLSTNKQKCRDSFCCAWCCTQKRET
nr:uncharacterized protein LOC124806770 [Hydra vulgaris]